MLIPAGGRLGPYEVGDQLGAGGMGVVYRARDPRLNRAVAIKVLPPADAGDPDRRRRFEREARAIATLSHPHICAIFDVGHQDGTDYLVLELVEGETLAARLKRGPLPLDELLACARDIAEAMSHAHDKGIVHRDLKPGNVIVTPAGAKVLDFGLAALVHQDAPSGAAEATATAPLTAAGTILGTLAYMSPEQIEGRPADARSDVFAFGTTLYEMATGRRAFDASSTPALIGAILRDEPPPLEQVRPGLPPSLERLIRSCVQKRPADRFSNMHDAALALGWIEAERQDRPPAAERAAPRGITRRGAIAAGGLAAAGTALGYLLGRLGPESGPASTTVFDLPFPEGTTPGAGLALSRDGRRLVLSVGSTVDGVFGLQLWSRELSADSWQPFTAVPRAPAQGAYPGWSPDGTEVACHVGDQLVRLRVPNGEPVVVCALPRIEGNLEYRGAAWLEDSTIVFGTATGGLMAVAAAGGEPQEVVARREGDSALRHPVVVSGRRVIFHALRERTPSELCSVDLDDPAAIRVITTTPASGAYAAGRLYFQRGVAVVGQAYDGSGQLSGDVERITMDTMSSTLNVGYAAVSAGGGHVAVMNTRPAPEHAWWYSRDGRTRTAIGDPLDQTSPAVSPDGRLIAISRRTRGEQRTLWVIDEDGSSARQITREHDALFPVWSRDGGRLVFRSTGGLSTNGNIFQVNVGGTPAVTPLAERLSSMYPAGWAADGDAVVWATDSTADPVQTGVYLSKPDEPGQRLIRATRGVSDPMVSPDGRWVAFSSPETGRHEIYIDSLTTPVPSPVRVTQDGGRHPTWRRDGRELYYARGMTLMAVSISSDDVRRPGIPVRLFDAPVPLSRRTYAPAPDGTRFVILVPTRPDEHSVRVALNWASSKT